MTLITTARLRYITSNGACCCNKTTFTGDFYNTIFELKTFFGSEINQHLIFNSSTDTMFCCL